MSMKPWLACVVLVFVAGADHTSGPSTLRVLGVGEISALERVWASQGTEYANTDSLVACDLGQGKVGLFATAKEGHRIDLFDAATGRYMKSFSREGEGPGEMLRPNGIAVVELPSRVSRKGAVQSFVLVVERDTHRVQAFGVQSLEPAGIFGEEILTRPYGVAVETTERDGTRVYVTDTDVAPEKTIKVFRLHLEGGAVSGEFVRHMGEASGIGAIQKAESITVDPRSGRVLVCDESEEAPNVKVYARDGAFTGITFADRFLKGDPEGIVVCEHQGRRYVILTEQRKEITIWHLFDANNYRRLGRFTGRPTVANTDGICLYTKPFGPFSEGAFFAVNDDADIHAFALADVFRIGWGTR